MKLWVVVCLSIVLASNAYGRMFGSAKNSDLSRGLSIGYGERPPLSTLLSPDESWNPSADYLQRTYPIPRIGQLAFSPKEKSTDVALAVLGVTLGYSLFDYVGYNLTKNNPTSLRAYRVLQAITHVSCTYYLYQKHGTKAALAFNVIWWTFGDDLLYYGYASMFNPGGSWEGRDVAQSVMQKGVRHAYWTPLGRMRGSDRRTPISGDAIQAQAALGFIAAIALTIELD